MRRNIWHFYILHLYSTAQTQKTTTVDHEYFIYIYYLNTRRFPVCNFTLSSFHSAYFGIFAEQELVCINRALNALYYDTDDFD